MTNEEIDAMTPGREMDAHVWLALNGRAGESIFLCRSVDGDIQPHTGTQAGHISPPHYSTSITDAWKVISLAESRQNALYIERGESGWVCQIMRDWTSILSSEVIGRSYGDTPMEAICKSALKAINHE